MIAVTHVVWLGVAVFLLGIVGLLSRRDAEGSAAGGCVSLWGAALVAVAYARWWGNLEGHLLAIVLVGVATLASVALLAVRVRTERD